LGYQRNLCHRPHSSPLEVTFCSTAGGHTPRRQVLVRRIFLSSIRAV
jgi:hypothetical protein